MACESNDRWRLVMHRVEHEAMVLLFERRALGVVGADVIDRSVREIF